MILNHNNDFLIDFIKKLSICFYKIIILLKHIKIFFYYFYYFSYSIFIIWEAIFKIKRFS